MADPKIKEYRGRIVKNTGDGMLVEFPRVVDAVSFCSVLTGDARFLPRFLLLLGELAMCLGEAGEVAPGLATVVELDRAGRQQALSWELRTATSLARPWRDQNRAAEARELLGSVYDRFTEGFDTADLRQAKSLLEHLR